MATSGKIQGTTINSSGSDVTSRYGTWIEWKRNSNNITNNTSNITVTVYVQRVDTYQYETAWDLETKPSVSLKVGGSAKSPTIYYIDTRNHKLCTVATWTGDVTHSADGTLKLALSCDWVMGNTSLYSGSISDNITLDTIPRASQPSCITWPQTTQNVGDIGSTFTIHMNKKGAFTHYVYCKWGSKTVEIGKNVADNVSWTIPIDFANDVPNSTTGTGTIYVDTYNGTNKIGTQSVSFTASVPAYNLTISNIALTGNNLLSGAYVQGKSTVTVNITATTMYGATIKSYSSTVDGKTYTGNSFTSSALSNGSKTVSVTVTDTRGKTATLSSSAFTVYAYAIPNITEFTLDRQEDETTVIATVKGTISAINNKNAKVITVELNGVTQTISSSSYTINGTTTFTNVPTDNTLTATAKITDSYTSVTQDAVLPTVAVTMDYHYSGKGIAMGKVSETEGLLDVAWEIKTGKPEKTLDNFSYRGHNVIDANEDDTTYNWGLQGNLATSFYTDASKLTKPSTWGFLVNVTNGVGSSEIHQLWLEQAGGSIYHRGGNGSGFKSWYRLLDNANCPDYVVEQGTSGIWAYRKWSSGDAECWGNISTTPTNVNATNSITVSLPFTFANTSYKVNLSPAKTALYVGSFGDCNTNGDISHTTTSFVMSYKYSYGTAYAVSFNAIVKGKWK